MQGGRPLDARFLRPHRSETAAFAKQMMERSYQMAPLRPPRRGLLVIGDYQKKSYFFRGAETAVFLLAKICKVYYLKQKNGARYFCVWTSPDTNGGMSCSGPARRKEVVSR